jgi:putative ATPase
MEPLAAQLRPDTLDGYVGQKHLLGEGKPLRAAILGKHLFSFILWGPPGVGKTTIARIYANAVDANFYELSAVSAGKDDIREIVAAVTNAKPSILFLDEIHRFNKAQQDFLLPFVESGKLTLIGATTENPSFEVIPALLSRARVFVLESLSDEDMREILTRSKVKMKDDARDWLIAVAGGDARQALTVLDATVRLYKTVTLEHLKEAVQSKHLRYDKAGEEHYNTISAFIKSRSSATASTADNFVLRFILVMVALSTGLKGRSRNQPLTMTTPPFY